MNDWWDGMLAVMASEVVLGVVRAVIIVFVGWVLARVVSRNLVRVTRRYTDAQQSMLIRRISYWVILGLALVSGLRELGFNLTVLLGAAGILTVAVGFASQTSASNLISGLFLIGERPFAVGDVIKVGNTTGEVLSVDLLSVKLRTFDNLMVRLPNETLVKSEITNLTRFPIRRLDVKVGVAYKEDVARVRKVLEGVADTNPLCLEEPRPVFIFLGFGDSALDLQFSVWAKRENFLRLRNSIHEEIKKAFDAEGIEIPFPHRSLYAGEATEPFPIRLVNDAPTRPAADTEPS
ncbi:mechanosensitive ion channel family protein [Ectothiorhodospiraceae bacterium 2226]|nr:mechanosensitive ion channel family protein [Ectothiorhodospiraceae bacterium 2226]